MYPYHGRIKQRIKAGELTNWYFTDDYPGIGEALVLVFGTMPFLRPVRLLYPLAGRVAAADRRRVPQAGEAGR